jgi:hypothetical protein
MNPRDPFEVFERLDPFEPDVSMVTDADEERLQRILASPISVPQSKSGRRRWMLGLGVGAMVVATAAFALVRREHATNPTGIACYAAANLDAEIAVVGPSLDPITSCATAWSDGTLSSAGAPQLTACVTETGVVAVFPGDVAVCSKLGLAELDPERNDEQQAVVELQERMASVYSGACLRQPDALATAQRLLDESGLTGWKVQLAENFPPGLECGAATPLPELRTVIVGGARPAP